jgi:hypothetical protein
MSESQQVVELDVELNAADVAWLDEEAARVGCTRSDLICVAVDQYLERAGLRASNQDNCHGSLKDDSRKADTAPGEPSTE